MTTVNQKEYLKKYLGIGKAPGEKKKKKKKEKAIGSRLRIIDDDADILISQEIQDDISAANEDAPQIVAVIDERPPSLRIDEQTKSNLWTPIGGTSNINAEIQSLKLSSSFKLSRQPSGNVRKYNLNVNKPKREQELNTSSRSDVSPPRSRQQSEHSLSRKHIKSEDASPRRENEDYFNRDSNRPEDYSPPRKRNRDDDLIPKMENTEDDDHSPPRRRNRHDISLSPKREDKYDSSPPRRKRDNSPSRRVNRNGNNSPTRASGRKNVSPLSKSGINDGDCSPRRKDKHDNSPSSKRRALDRSPQPKVDRAEDNSPPRRKRYDEDISPPRRKKHDEDISPPRTRVKSEDSSPPRSNRRADETHKKTRWGKWSPEASPSSSRDLSPKRPEKSDDKLRKTLDGKTAGLQNAKDLIKETTLLRHREDEMFRNLTAEVSGMNAATVVRAKKAKDLEEEARQKHEKKTKEKYDRWGKGLKQVEDHNEKMAEQLHEMSKPLARYADDEDLEKYLKEQEREGDPMLAYIRQKKKKETVAAGVPEKPVYMGEFMPNRFGISPGYRWDGVDRSNGYETKWFQTQNMKRANQEEALKWSTEDM